MVWTLTIDGGTEASLAAQIPHLNANGRVARQHARAVALNAQVFTEETQELPHVDRNLFQCLWIRRDDLQHSAIRCRVGPGVAIRVAHPRIERDGQRCIVLQMHLEIELGRRRAVEVAAPAGELLACCFVLVVPLRIIRVEFKTQAQRQQHRFHVLPPRVFPWPELAVQEVRFDDHDDFAAACRRGVKLYVADEWPV